MHLQEILDLTLTQGQSHMKQCSLHHVTYLPAMLKLLQPMVKEMQYQEKTLFDRSRGSRSHEMLPSTLDFMWPIHQQSLILLYPMIKERMHYKKIDYLTLTLGSGSHKILPSTLDIMWPMYQQSLILLHPMFKEKMHLQENTLFDFDLWVKVTHNVANCPLHHVTYAPTEFEVTFIRKFNIWPRVKVTGNVAQYPLHHVTYSATKFEVATSNPVKEEIHLQKNVTHGRTTDWLWYEINIPFFSKEKACVTMEW